VEEFGLFVEGIRIPAEGLIHVTSLADDHYRYDRTTHTLTGFRAGNSFRLGDRVRVTVARVDIDRRELDFRLLERGRRSPSRGGKLQPPRGKKNKPTRKDKKKRRKRR
jgi:ribonuclease R